MDRAGRGLAQVWRRQIQQLNRVSLEMASAIVAAYPSPQLLVQVRCSRGRGPVPCHLSGTPTGFPRVASVKAQECLVGQRCRSAEIQVSTDPGWGDGLSFPAPQSPHSCSSMGDDCGWCGTERSFSTFRLIGGVFASKNARTCLQTYRCAVGKA